MYQPTGSQPVNQGAYGFGDLNPTFFLAPSKATSSSGVSGRRSYCPRPPTAISDRASGALALRSWLSHSPANGQLGALVNNVFSVGGQSSRADVNQMLFQYFINYNLKHGYYITWQPTLTANWETSKAVDGRCRWRWHRKNHEARIPASESHAQFYGNAVHPERGSSWSMRLQIAFLFPKLTKQQQKMMMEQKLKQMEQAPPQK